jgi:hypothetical protein
MNKIKLIPALKNKKLKEWFYLFKHGHTFLLNEEVNIICNTRKNKMYKRLSEYNIQKLIKLQIKQMYKEKFPNTKKWSLNNF